MADKPIFTAMRAVRRRFDEAGADALPDYEMLELLLCLALPRRDVKPLAKRLIERFGSVGGVLGAEKGALKEVEGIGDGVVHTLKLVEALGVRTLREAVIGRPVIGTWQAVLDYCTVPTTDIFSGAFLDSHNALIAERGAEHGNGRPRGALSRAKVISGLSNGASAVVMVHNHPSGSPPVPRRYRAHEGGREAAPRWRHRPDNLVIGRSRHVSFREAACCRTKGGQEYGTQVGSGEGVSSASFSRLSSPWAWR